VSRNQARLSFQGTSYSNFVNALRSPSTRQGYENSLRRYLEYHKLKSPDDLLIHTDNPRFIESQIIDYIVSLGKDGISYASKQFYVAPIFTFYQLNDVVLNRKKVSRYLGEYKRVVKDNAYTTEQIQQMLQNADIRMRMILLLLTSTGARIGALPSLTLGNLTRLPEFGIYRVLFYEDSSVEYYNFTTRECAATGIDNYLLYRQRCAEDISFNETTQRWEPDDTPLTPHAFWNISDFGAKCEKCETINTITLEKGELKKQESEPGLMDIMNMRQVVLRNVFELMLCPDNKSSNHNPKISFRLSFDISNIPSLSPL
jgi:hypothetical protein